MTVKEILCVDDLESAYGPAEAFDENLRRVADYLSTARPAFKVFVIAADPKGRPVVGFDPAGGIEGEEDDAS